MRILEMLQKTPVPSPEPSKLRTIIPSDVQADTTAKTKSKPTSRVDVLKVIENNVENELEVIDFELERLRRKQMELEEKKRRYLRVLKAAKDDEPGD